MVFPIKGRAPLLCCLKTTSTGTCRGSLYECPFVQKYQDKLIRSNHPYDIAGKSANPDGQWKKRNRASSAKANINEYTQTDRSKISKNKSNELEKIKDEREDRGSNSNSVTGIRSTRAQDLRSQCNRDLLKPKSVCEKTRVTSPYATATTQKKKRSNVSCDLKVMSNRSLPSTKYVPDESKKKAAKNQNRNEKSGTSKKRDKKDNGPSVQREKTQDVIHPKIVKKAEDKTKNVDDNCGDRPELKKSQTFFICKGPKRGEGDDVSKIKSSSGTENSDSEYEEPPSPEPSPLTHNDSFCLILKSSQNWSQKKYPSDGENLFPVNNREKCKKDEKGILKSSNRDLKSTDSLEKIESEKIVRFSDDLIRKRKVLRKYVRRKNKLQNNITAAWYRKSKIFQKYIQVLRAKSVLHAASRDHSPENSKPFPAPVYARERYEAEMLGLVPRKSKYGKARSKSENC